MRCRQRTAGKRRRSERNLRNSSEALRGGFEYPMPMISYSRRHLVMSVAAVAFIAGAMLFPEAAGAHGVSRRDAGFVETIDGPAIAPFLYLGAKHMVTGYDHLLFL